MSQNKVLPENSTDKIEIEVSEGSLAPLGIMALAGGGYLYYKKKKSKK